MGMAHSAPTSLSPASLGFGGRFWPIMEYQRYTGEKARPGGEVKVFHQL